MSRTAESISEHDISVPTKKPTKDNCDDDEHSDDDDDAHREGNFSMYDRENKDQSYSRIGYDDDDDDDHEEDNDHRDTIDAPEKVIQVSSKIPLTMLSSRDEGTSKIMTFAGE